MEYLSRRGISYTVRDITEDPDALRELLELGSYQTPTTLIDGEHIVIGFDQARLDRLLGLT